MLVHFSCIRVNVWDIFVSVSLLTKAQKDQATMRKPVGEFQAEQFHKTKQQRRLVAISIKHSTEKTELGTTKNIKF